MLVDFEIREAVSNGEIGIDDLVDENIGPNSYDFILSPSISYQKYKNKRYHIVDPHKTSDTFETADFNEYIIRPGEFILGSSKEYFKIGPGYVAFVYGRSSWARLGIQIEAAGLLDSGWEGNITLEIVNYSYDPIILRAGDKIGQVVFIKTSTCATPYYLRQKSKYDKQTGATPSRLIMDNY